MHRKASTKGIRFPQIRTLSRVLPHIMFTWPPDKSPFLTWRTLHSNTENCANGFTVLHFMLTWSSAIICFFDAFCTPVVGHHCSQTFGMRSMPANQRDARDNDSWHQHRKYRTVVVTLLNSIPFWDKPKRADNLKFEKNHAMSTQTVQPSKTPTPWAPLTPRDGLRESSRIDLKEGARRDNDTNTIYTNMGWLRLSCGWWRVVWRFLWSGCLEGMKLEYLRPWDLILKVFLEAGAI